MNLALSEEQVLDGRVIDVKLKTPDFHNFDIKTCNVSTLHSIFKNVFDSNHHLHLTKRNIH
jgi:hypothetical protein